MPPDKERIDAIPETAAVLGIDSADRPHLFAHRHGRTAIWVLDPAGDTCEHFLATERPLSAWVAFVADRTGWRVRHHVEKPAGADLFDAEATPPTREEVL